MSASMTENISGKLTNPALPQVHKDISDDRYKGLRRPRKVRFFVNGDRFFKGKKLYITPHRYYNFNDLLNDLTGKLPASLNLPYGVRQIFTPVGGRRVSGIEDLQDGETYVCAGFEGFKVIKYGRTELEPWSVGKTVRLNHLQDSDVMSDGSYGSYRYRGFATNAFHPGRYFRAIGPHNNALQTHRRWPGTFGNATRSPAGLQGGLTEAVPVKPKVITIVRNGPRPRNSVKILLNKRSLQSFEQLLLDISEAFGPKWKNNRVQKLYTTHGKEVKGISEFFREDDCFIALGNERLDGNDVADIIDELFPDSAYAKLLLKDWEKQRRRDKQKASNALRNSQSDKRDSGFVEGSDIGSHPEQDYEALSTNRSQRQAHHGKRIVAIAMANEQDPLMDSESGSPRHYYIHAKLPHEHRKAAGDECDKARRRQSRLVDQEKRAQDEERKRRGLASLNPLKPLDDIRKRDPVEKDNKKTHREKVEESDGKTEEENQAEKTKKEREQAERAARARMAAAEKAEREDKEGGKVETELRRENDSWEKGEKENNAKVYKDSEKLDIIEKETEEKENKEKPDKERKRKKEKDSIVEKNTSRKARAKVVRRSKAERQLSSDNFINDHYELGQILGDGNFAVVKMSRLKSSGQEFAMKVIDKPKLKGKEHMVENEIDIMKDCSHPNIVKLYEEYETDDKIYLVMELVKGGDLFDAITQSVKFGEVDSAHMVKDLCNALYYLHSRSIVHRDLKPENLLVHRNKDGTITLKLADFGLALEVKEPIFTVCGTPTYVAPEILTEIGYGLEVDMWAVGVITYILLCGFPPFRSPDRNQTELFEFIKAGEYTFLPPYWDNVSESAKDLIRHLLIVDRSRRYTAIDVLSHIWIVCGGNTMQCIPGVPNINTYCAEIRQDLEVQARYNYENYQKLKEKKKREALCQ